jgi:hypothetical protein
MWDLLRNRDYLTDGPRIAGIEYAEPEGIVLSIHVVLI